MTQNGLSNTNARLAIFVPSMRGGGAERSMLRLASGLAARNYPVDLILARAEGPYMAEVPDNVNVIDLNVSRTVKSIPGLVRYLRKARPKAMVSAMEYANMIALWSNRLARVPTLTAVNEQNTISISSQFSHNRRSRLMPRLAKHMYPRADYVIGNSQGVSDDLADITGLPIERIHTIYNPVVTPELKEKAEGELDDPWFSAGEPPVVVAVGSLKRQKDYPTLIEAFAQVRKARSARLLILGEGRERERLEALVNQLNLEDDVRLPGFVQNPCAYMARAGVYALSSRWEGLPTVLVEALYCGPSLVATDCPSGPREILADGKYGQLTPVGDVDALARAIQVALDGDGPRRPSHSWKPFEVNAIIDQYEEILVK